MLYQPIIKELLDMLIESMVDRYLLTVIKSCENVFNDYWVGDALSDSRDIK